MTLPAFTPSLVPGEVTVWKPRFLGPTSCGPLLELLEELQRRHAAELAASVCVPAYLLSGPGHRRDQGG